MIANTKRRDGPARPNARVAERFKRFVPTSGLGKITAAAALLVIAISLVYCRTFGVPWLMDDYSAIPGNWTITHLWPIGPALHPPAEAGVGGRPLLNLSFAISYAFSGYGLFGYHCFNLAIHALSALTLFGLVRRTLSQPVCSERLRAAAGPLALAVSGIWSLHPVLTNAVTYVSQRAESMMGLFYLLTLYCFIRGIDLGGARPPGALAVPEGCEITPGFASAPGGRAPPTWQILSVMACVCGMLTKEVMVTAPIMVFLYDRTFVSGTCAEAGRRHWPLYLGLALTWIPLGFLMTDLNHRGVGYSEGISWRQYALIESHVLVKYLGLALWPSSLVFDYAELPIPTALEVRPYLIIVGALLTLTALALRRWPRVGFAAAWFFVILAPASSVVPVAGQPMAESRMYLPLIGVVGLIVVAAFHLFGRRSWMWMAGIAVGLGVVAFARNRVYATPASVWTDTVAKRPDSYRAHGQLGFVIVDLPGRLDDAIAEYREALRLNPDYAAGHSNLGSALARRPETLNEALVEHEKSLHLKPDDAPARYNYGNALAKIPGRQQDAIAQFREALRLDPDYPQARNNLGVQLARQPGQIEAARVEFRAAVRLEPLYAGAHNNLGKALTKQPGQLREAIAECETAIRLKPDFAEAHNNLGAALLLQPERAGEATREFETALRLQPKYAAARANLAAAIKAAAGPPRSLESRSLAAGAEAR